jgi:hypothetical protein
VSLSVSIMAHPDRAAQVDELRARLGTAVPVAWDFEGVPGRDPERVWRTARRGWELHNPRADWHLLLQDDAIVAPDLLPALEVGLKHVPERAVVSLYIGTGRPLAPLWERLGGRADLEGAAWIVGARLMWGVAIVVPTRMIGDLLDYGDKQRGIPDDMRAGRWARQRRYEAWFPWPSLVDHPDGQSLVGHGSGRKALKYIGDSALTWDPSGPVVR